VPEKIWPSKELELQSKIKEKSLLVPKFMQEPEENDNEILEPEVQPEPENKVAIWAA